jgi:sialidase-1
VLPIAAGISNGPNAGLYVFSGRKVAPGARTELLADSWFYDPMTNEWEQLPDVKAGGGAPRCVMAGTSTNWGDEGIIVMGGDSGELFMELENLRLRAAELGGGAGDALTLAHNAILDNHPGFSRDVLYFDVNRRVWSLIGELPFKSPVTTSAVWWGNDLVLPTGEVGPGVRTPDAWFGAPREDTDLSNQSDQPFHETVDLFVSDLRDGDPLIFRIPALALTARGTLLAACAERKGSHGDWADIDLIMRRSTDGGLTWDEPQYIAVSPGETVDNATFIVDEANDIIHFVHQINYHKCYYLRSEDDGLTWSEPVDITDAFKPLLEPRGWEVLAPGPGHGIRLTSGRLVVPVWVAQGPRAHRPSVTSTIYSDDNGETWHAGEVIADNIESAPNPSEMMAIELTDGRVMMSIRNESTRNRRLISYSDDGATNWTTPEFHAELYEPICMASMARLSTARHHDRDRILFSNPNSQDYTNVHLSWGARTRANVTVRMSYDEGQSWPVSRVLEPDLSGYSDLAASADGMIYCLYERDNLYEERGRFASKHISLARFNLAWLSGAQDVVQLSGGNE